MTRAQKIIIGLCLLVGIGVLARPFVPSVLPGFGPVSSGSIHGYLIRETGDTTYETERTVVALRNGSIAEYLDSKGHKLDILDDDAAAPTSGKAPQVVKALADAKPIEPPLLILYDATSGRVLTKTPAPPSLSADAILDQFKKAGG
jgi:hypothetical protein